MSKPYRARALLIEDAAVYRSALSRLLEQAGLEVIATNGRAGVDLLERKPFDLLVCSLRLSEVDSLGAVKIAHDMGIPSLSVAPAYGEFEAREACRLGSDSVWAHPVDAERFLERVHSLVPTVAVPPAGEGESRTVLLIDDNDQTRAFMKRTLESAGMRALESPSGHKGLRLLEAERVDLIILDVIMPGMDGLTTCQILKSNSPTSNIPVLICTVKAGDATQLQAIAAAADDYLVKPFRPHELVLRAERLISKRRSDKIVC